MNTKALRGCVGIVAAVVALGLSGCTPAEETPDSSVTASPSSGGDVSATPSRGGGGVEWRGALFTRPGWRLVKAGDTTACLLPAGGSVALCDHTDKNVPRHVGNWLWLYADDITEPEPDPGQPADDDSFDRGEMDRWPFKAGQVPDELKFDDEPDLVKKGTAPVGDRTAWYAKWRMHDEKLNYHIGQRWLLANSRLCLISLSRDEKAATEVYQLVQSIDLSGYRPTKA